jgi:hypothetical protein
MLSLGIQMSPILSTLLYISEPKTDILLKVGGKMVLPLEFCY